MLFGWYGFIIRSVVVILVDGFLRLIEEDSGYSMIWGGWRRLWRLLYREDKILISMWYVILLNIVWMFFIGCFIGSIVECRYSKNVFFFKRIIFIVIRN